MTKHTREVSRIHKGLKKLFEGSKGWNTDLKD